MLVTARNFPKEDEVCAWRLHPNTRNQAKGMLEVLRLAHVNSEFESRVSVRPSNPYPTVGRTLRLAGLRPYKLKEIHMRVSKPSLTPLRKDEKGSKEDEAAVRPIRLLIASSSTSLFHIFSC